MQWNIQRIWSRSTRNYNPTIKLHAVLGLEPSLDELERTRFKRNMEEAMTESAGYLLENLPIVEQVVRDGQYLEYQNNGRGKGVLAIKRVYYNVCGTLNSDAVKKIFNMKDDDSTDRLCYNVCRMLNSDALKKILNMKDDDSTDSLIDAVEEFKLYQHQKIPSIFYEAKPSQTRRRDRCIPIGNMHMVYWIWQQRILTMIQNMFV